MVLKDRTSPVGNVRTWAAFVGKTKALYEPVKNTEVDRTFSYKKTSNSQLKEPQALLESQVKD